MRNIWKRPFFYLALTVAVFASVTEAGEKHAERRDGKHLEKFVTKLEKELKLSPEQTAQVREILRPDSLVMPPHHAPGLAAWGGDFSAQLRGEKVDTIALNRAFAERQSRMRMFHERSVGKFVQLHAVLTPAQRVKLADRLDEWREKAAKKHRKK